MAGDTRWLFQKTPGGTYYARMFVPRPLQALLGKSIMLRSLHTKDLRVALSRRLRAIAEFEAVFERAKTRSTNDDLVQEALAWRNSDWTKLPTETSASIILHDIADRLPDQDAEMFLGIAHGTATPLLLHLEAFLTEAKTKPQTKITYRSDITAFAAWAPPTIEAITRRVAGQWVTETQVQTGASPGTGNRKIAALSAYWHYMRRRGVVEANPWSDQRIAVARNADKPRRAFSDAEIATLLSGDADQELHDAMMIAALSGLRVGEIFALIAATCAGGMFDVRGAKTPSGNRKVPVHSALAELVARRTGTGGRLFPREAENMKRRFNKYRIKLGVHDRRDGANSSTITFHSFRHWHTTALLNAGVAPAVADVLTGHALKGETLRTYHGGFSVEILRSAVERVQLPQLCAQAAGAVARDAIIEAGNALTAKRMARLSKS